MWGRQGIHNVTGNVNFREDCADGGQVGGVAILVKAANPAAPPKSTRRPQNDELLCDIGPSNTRFTIMRNYYPPVGKSQMECLLFALLCRLPSIWTGRQSKHRSRRFWLNFILSPLIVIGRQFSQSTSKLSRGTARKGSYLPSVWRCFLSNKYLMHYIHRVKTWWSCHFVCFSFAY